MLEKLYSRRRFGIRPGLDRVNTLLERLGNPERTFPCIHVVGTNGKGSTSAFLSSILTSAGFRTALFTSPHLVSFNERFRINDRDIDQAQLTTALEQVLSVAPEEATFFEIVTSVAAVIFARNKVEIAVMEAGMGGQSDATAAITGIMTLVTPISLDHRDYLGETVEMIAREKAGITEPGTPLLAAAQLPSVMAQIRKHCIKAGSRIYSSGSDFSSSWKSEGLLDYNGIHVKMTGLRPGIPGSYQAENAAVAMAAAEALSAAGFHIPSEAIHSGLAAARWPGRMELVAGAPPLLLDGAHNPAGAAALKMALDSYRYSRLLLVTGIMADKDAAAILGPLAPLVSKAFCVQPAVDRAMVDSTLCGLLTELGVCSAACGSVANGIAAARSEAAPQDLILICGSLFTVGEAKAWLAGEQFIGIRG